MREKKNFHHGGHGVSRRLKIFVSKLRGFRGYILLYFIVLVLERRLYFDGIFADNGFMNKIRFCRITVLLCLFALFPLGVGAQTAAAAAKDKTDKSDKSDKDEVKLPNQFRQIVLGMGLDELKAALLQDSMFNFRGDRDVSFLPAQDESLVETSGSSFVKRAFFQLRGGTLFIMAYTLNTGMVDHYSMFTDLVEKYGQPTYLDPKVAVWESKDIRVSIERPLTIKYIDKKVFDDIINESTLIQSKRVQQRQEFLDEF